MGTKIFRRAFWRIVSGSLSYPDGIDATPVGQTTPAKVTGTDVEATGNFIGNGAELTGITGATGGVANEGSTTIGADTVDDGSGEIALQIGLTTQYTLDNDGYFKKDASAPAPAADEDIITRGYADSRYLSTWANAYGIRWDAVNDIIQPGIIVSNEFFSFDYTSMPVHDKCGRRCVTNASNVLQYYLHPDDSTLKASGEAANIDGTDGQVMSEFTAFHSLLVNDGNYRYRLVGERPFNLTLSDDSVVGSTLNPWFFEGGSYSEKRYVGAFEGVLYDDTVSDYIDGDGTGQYAAGDKVHSVAGYTPITSESRPTFRTACAVDGDYHQHGFFGEEALLLLYITKYKDWDSQTELPGYTEGGAWDFAKVCKTGITKTLGNHDGSINWEDADATLRCATDQTGLVVVNSFLGIENYYGHLWKWTDGINIQFIGDPLTDAKIYVCSNPADWADGTDTNYIDTGLDLPLATGYQTDLHDGYMLPSEASGGSSSTFIPDRFTVGAAGWRAFMSSGRLDSGATAGAAARNAAYASSFGDGSVGGRVAA